MEVSSNYREQYARYKRYFKRVAQEYQRRPEVRASIELLLTLLTISFFAIFALRPTVNTIAELWANIGTQRQIKQQLEEKLSNLAQAQVVWAQEQNRIELLNQALPTQPQPDVYLAQVEGLVAVSNLRLVSFNVDKILLLGKQEQTKKDKQVSPPAIGVTFAVSGDFQEIMSFLEELENLRRPTLAKSLSFGIGQGKQAGSLVLTVSGQVPFFAE